MFGIRVNNIITQFDASNNNIQVDNNDAPNNNMQTNLNNNMQTNSNNNYSFGFVEPSHNYFQMVRDIQFMIPVADTDRNISLEIIKEDNKIGNFTFVFSEEMFKNNKSYITLTSKIIKDNIIYDMCITLCKYIDENTKEKKFHITHPNFSITNV